MLFLHLFVHTKEYDYGTEVGAEPFPRNCGRKAFLALHQGPIKYVLGVTQKTNQHSSNFQNIRLNQNSSRLVQITSDNLNPMLLISLSQS